MTEVTTTANEADLDLRDELDDAIAMVAEKLGSLDVADQVEIASMLAADLAKISAAAAQTETDLATTRRQIGERQLSGPDGDAVADRILSGEGLDGWSGGLAALEAKKEELSAALVALRRREGDAATAARRAPEGFAAALHEAVADIGPPLFDRAIAAADELQGVYLIAKTFAVTTRSGPAGQIVMALENALVELNKAGLTAPWPQPVPDDVRAALGVANDTIRSARLAVPTQIDAPRPSFDTRRISFSVRTDREEQEAAREAERRGAVRTDADAQDEPEAARAADARPRLVDAAGA